MMITRLLVVDLHHFGRKFKDRLGIHFNPQVSFHFRPDFCTKVIPFYSRYFRRAEMINAAKREEAAVALTNPPIGQ